MALRLKKKPVKVVSSLGLLTFLRCRCCNGASRINLSTEYAFLLIITVRILR